MSVCDKICAAVIIMGVLFIGKAVIQLQNNSLGLNAQTISMLERGYYGFSTNSSK